MKLSIVISVYNEEKVIDHFYNAIYTVLSQEQISYELIFVNDGSGDDTRIILDDIVTKDPNVVVINFSRNFGHEAAMIAGIDHSKGDAVICMDADLQHPPASIRPMLEKYAEGYEVITMMRTKNPDSSWFQRITSKSFYFILNKVSGNNFDVNASDFFLMSKRVSDLLKTDFREQSRFLRGFIQIVGFKRTSIEYEASARAGGESKYSLFGLFKYSFNVMLTFSNLPLKLGVISGIIIGIFGGMVGVWEIIMRFKGVTPPGYTTLVVLISFLFAILFFIVGIIGEYIAVLFKEIKGRPIYIVDDINRSKD
ncbi:MAG: glycosyltransferase family 2 protein [Fulvivirga sp.]